MLGRQSELSKRWGTSVSRALPAWRVHSMQQLKLKQASAYQFRRVHQFKRLAHRRSRQQARVATGRLALLNATAIVVILVHRTPTENHLFSGAELETCGRSLGGGFELLHIQSSAAPMVRSGVGPIAPWVASGMSMNVAGTPVALRARSLARIKSLRSRSPAINTAARRSGKSPVRSAVGDAMDINRV